MTTFKEFAEKSGIELVATYKGVHAEKCTTHKPERPEFGAAMAEPWQHFLWSVTLRLNGREFTTDYRKGLGHCSRTAPLAQRKYRQPMTQEIAKSLKPYGSRITISDLEGFVYVEPPTLEEVLHSLQADAQSGEHLLFEDFASDFGYDPDSREAERVWRACQTTRGQLQKLMSGNWLPGGDAGAVQMFDAFLALTEDEED